MDIVTLEVKSRDENISAPDIRRKGLIPAVYYGLKQKNRNLAMDYQTFRKVFREAGTNTVLELVIDGKDKTNVLVHDIQYDPVTDKFYHVDFKFVDLNKEVTTEIPLVFTGESKAVRELGGTLMENRDVITVKCIARNIPKQIEVDISPIEDFQISLHIKDVKIPEGITVLDDEDLTIATVVPPKEEEEEEVVEEEVPEGEEVAEGEEAKEGEAEEEVKEGEKPAEEKSEKKE